MGWKKDKCKCSFCVWAFIAASQQGVSKYRYYIIRISNTIVLLWLLYTGKQCSIVALYPIFPLVFNHNDAAVIFYDVIESHNRTLYIISSQKYFGCFTLENNALLWLCTLNDATCNYL